MAKDAFAERRKALEESFFYKQNKDKLEAFKAKRAQASRVEALASASGLQDTAVLEALDELGVTPIALAAIRLVPLVAVAWADGKLDEEERAAILSAASQAGIDGDSEAGALLEGWLSEAPGDDLVSTWKAYVESLKSTLQASALASLEQDAIGGARSVAEAAGGILGIGSVSGSEKAVLEDLASAF
jgi:tellurite resistance protein